MEKFPRRSMKWWSLRAQKRSMPVSRYRGVASNVCSNSTMLMTRWTGVFSNTWQRRKSVCVKE